MIHLARGVGLPTANVIGNICLKGESNHLLLSCLPKHSNVKPVPTGTLIVCEKEAIRAGARVFVTCETDDVGSPSPTEVAAVT